MRPLFNSPYFKTYFCLQLVFFLGRSVYAWILPLSPQEAYYWVYTLHPDLSYFDHPPLTAYTIYPLTRLFGPQPFTIRLGGLLYFFGFGWVVFYLGKRIWNEQTGFLAALLIHLLPTFSITALTMTPDGPLLFFWTLALLLVLKALQENKGWYIGAGCSLGLALLSKYTAVFFPLSLFLFLMLSNDHRRHLKTAYPYLGLALALLIFSPVVYWNYCHDWASFAFQSSERALEMGWFSLKELVAFLGSQMGILTPLVFWGLVWTIGLGLRRFFHPGLWEEKFLLSQGLPLVLFFTAVAFLEWVKINWLIPAYAPLILLMVAYHQKQFFKQQWVYAWYARWVWILAGLFFVLLHLWPLAPFIKVSSSLDTTTGWPELASEVDRHRPGFPGAREPFIFAWGHKTASELRFYLKGRPPVQAQTVLGKKALAYDYWFDPAPLIGRDALFVWSEFENFPEEKSGLLERYFERVEKLRPFTVYRGLHPLRTFYISRCYGYKGYAFTRP
jgi:hypothetical protein